MKPPGPAFRAIKFDLPWDTFFSGTFSMAHERGIDTYIIPFNIFVPPEFSRAHDVAMNNLDHFYFVDGDTAEIVKRYTRECVTQLLTEYPLLTDMGLTLGEGMGGMTPGRNRAGCCNGVHRAAGLGWTQVQLVPSPLNDPTHEGSRPEALRHLF